MHHGQNIRHNHHFAKEYHARQHNKTYARAFFQSGASNSAGSTTFLISIRREKFIDMTKEINIEPRGSAPIKEIEKLITLAS